MGKTIYLKEKQLAKLSNYILHETYDYMIGGEGDNTDYFHVTNNDEINEIVYPNEINLKSFHKKGELNPKLWKNEKLNGEVRLALLDIADYFWASMPFDNKQMKDCVLTGSICNYNWSNYSDIDLHIIVDFKKINKDVELVKSFFDLKKNEFNEHHEGLTIYGFPLEIYVQDTMEEHVSSGIYSLFNKKWLVKPKEDEIIPIGLEKYYIKEKSASIMSIIDDIIEKSKKENDKVKCQKILDEALEIKDEIKSIRKNDLEENGEMSSGNIIFKIIRRSKYFEKLMDCIEYLENKIESI